MQTQRPKSNDPTITGKEYTMNKMPAKTHHPAF
jgi:hypothetical protein